MHNFILAITIIAIIVTLTALYNGGISRLDFTLLKENIYAILSSIITIPVTVIGYIMDILKTATQMVSVVVAGILAIIILLADSVKQVGTLIVRFITIERGE